jgi:hypothetical protein
MRLVEVDKVDALGSRRRKNCKCLFFIQIHLLCFQYNQIECFRFFSATIFAFNIFKLNVFGRPTSLNLDIFKLNLFDDVQSGQHQIECF